MTRPGWTDLFTGKDNYDPLVYVTTYSWQDGTQVQRIRRSKLPIVVAECLKFDLDFSVTRRP